MKFVTLAAPLTQFDEIVRTCVINQQFHPEYVQQVMHENKSLRPFHQSNPYTALLRRGEALSERLGCEPRYEPFEDFGFTNETLDEYFRTVDAELSQLEQTRQALLQESSDDRTIVSQLDNLSGIDADLSQLRHLGYLKFRFGHMPRETYDSFRETLEAREDLFFFPTKTEKDQVYGAYFTLANNHDAVDTLFNSLHFVRLDIDDRVDGVTSDAIQALSRQAEEDDRQAAAVAEQIHALAVREEKKLLAACSYLRFQNEAFDMRRYAAQSKDNFYLVGWVPETELPALTEQFDRCADLSYVVDDAADVDHTLTPPTKLKSGFLSRIFEPFLRMYGLPNYHEIDPAPFMAFTYCLFAGIMFGDVGQGLCLILGGLALWRFKKMWLGRIIACCGVSSTIFGFVYGSVFGFEELLPGFKVLEGNNVVFLLLASIGLGVVMLFLVMLFNVINGIHQKDYEKCLFGANGLCGMVFYFGFVAAALVTLLTDINLFTPAYLLPVVVLPLVLMLFKEPLGKLLAGDPDWKPESLGGLLVSGFFELFETVLSFVTNTLSFLRIGAYAISHVSLMLVVWTMAGANLNPIVLVIGNLFVMGFEGMLVGIQVLRLEFYELFGRFYDDGGREYSPKVIDYTAKNANAS